MAKKRKGNARPTHQKNVFIDALGPGGWGVAGKGRERIFIWGSFPGDVVDIEVVRRLRGRTEAVVERVVKRNAHLVKAQCAHFDVCGGCLWQHLDYSDQRRLKLEIVQFCFDEFALNTDLIAPVMGSKNTYAYRNKMDFSFGGETSDATLGMYVSDVKVSNGRVVGKRGQVPEVFQVDECKLQSNVANQVVARVRDLIQGLELAAFDPMTQEGIMRSLVIRQSASTGELLVHFLVAEDCQELLRPVADQLLKELPSIAGVVLLVNPKRSKYATPELEVLLAGRGAIQDNISDVVLNVSPRSFLQVNTAMAESLYEVALDFAQLTGSEKVLDLYCGTGSLTLLLAKQAAVVKGVEVIDSAVHDAKQNAVINGVDNATFVCGDVLEILPNLVESGELPDVVTVNPPRAGIYRSVVKRICASKPRRIVYISCSPQTLARDLLRFEKGGYKTVAVQPVDMFPHTPHIEVVAKLERYKN